MNRRPISYLQTDRRWKNLPYRVPGENATIGGSGCGPTAAAMLIETLTGKTFTPVDACEWAVYRGYKALNQGTYYSYFIPQFAAFGIGCSRLSGNSCYGFPDSQIHQRARDLLKAGYYLIALMGKGLWTSGGHFVVVWEEDGKVRINDPASTKTQRLNGDIRTFRSQVKYYWAIDARKYNEEGEDMTAAEVQKIVDKAVDKALADRDEAVAKAAQKVSPWAEKAFEKAKAKGIYDGTRPGGVETREMTAVVLDRLGMLEK